MAPFALLGLSFGMGLFWMVAAGLAALLGRGPVARAAALVVTLTGAELARSYVLTGLPWALIGMRGLKRRWRRRRRWWGRWA